MKIPFVKQNNNALSWIAAGVGSAVAASAGIWFYLRGRRLAAAEAYRLEHAQDYLEHTHPVMKKHKSDVGDLADIVNHRQG